MMLSCPKTPRDCKAKERSPCGAIDTSWGSRGPMTYFTGSARFLEAPFGTHGTQVAPDERGGKPHHQTGESPRFTEVNSQVFVLASADTSTRRRCRPIRRVEEFPLHVAHNAMDQSFTDLAMLRKLGGHRPQGKWVSGRVRGLGGRQLKNSFHLFPYQSVDAHLAVSMKMKRRRRVNETLSPFDGPNLCGPRPNFIP